MKLACKYLINRHSISLLKKTGYDGIEPSAADQFNPEKNSFVEMKLLKSLAEGSDLKIVALGALYPHDIELLSPDPAMRKRGEQYFQNLIRISSDLGVRMLHFGTWPSGIRPQNVSLSDGYKWLINLLQVCGELASKNDIRIVIEEVNRDESNMITNMRELLNFISDVNSPAVGITADLYHMSKEDHNIIQALEEANGLIWHVHLSDTDRLAPGEGSLDFTEIVSKLKELNYGEYLSLEIKPSLVVEQTLLKVKKLIKRIL